jgi:hypothetical protein
VVPILDFLFFDIEVLGDMVASFCPIRAKVDAEPATPSGSGLSSSPRRQNVSLLRTFGARIAMHATMSLDMMGNEVLVQEVFGVADVALKLFGTFLVSLFMSFPVRLLYERFVTNSTEILSRCFRTSSSLLARHTCLVVIFLR